jgi:hypothetical protein
MFSFSSLLQLGSQNEHSCKKVHYKAGEMKTHLPVSTERRVYRELKSSGDITERKEL